MLALTASSWTRQESDAVLEWRMALQMPGPLLYLIYIDQVASSVTHSNITMSADDIAMYKIISNPSDYTYLQEDILSLCSWIAKNYLTLNSKKCRYMIFTRKHQPTLPTSDLFVNNHHTLVKTNHYKYLGRNLSPDPSWSHHIDHICTNTRKLVGMLNSNNVLNKVGIPYNTSITRWGLIRALYSFNSVGELEYFCSTAGNTLWAEVLLVLFLENVL